jgi:NADPH-dependent ferric siderophore reductase
VRSRRRQGPLRHVLVAADLVDLPVVELLLADLPASAYGQVYVETPAGAELPELAAPARLTVTRLTRTADTAPGDLLGAAIAGWVAEWLPEEPCEDRSVALWAGATVRDRVAPVGAPLLPL